MPTTPSPTGADLPRHHPNAAGLDIGAHTIWAAVPPERDPQPVRAFGTFTPDLQALADWLVACGIQSVAMESTGVYWVPVFEVLEARGLEACLVNARQVQNVPGRKSDVQDCQWLQRLHTYGLLSASFRPAADLCALRAYLRHRAMLIEHRAAHIQHMQKALQQMNLQLTQVLSDLSGTTGLAIIRAIVAGERDPVVLARLRHPRCRSSDETIAKALTGHYRPEHVFALQQALALYDAYTAQIAECDAEVERHYRTLKPDWPADAPPPPPLGPDPKVNSHSKNRPAFDVRAEVYRLVGVDLTAVGGLDDSSVQTLLAEIGRDMSKWPSEKHFGSWLGLAPHHAITGGRVISRRTLKVRNRAAQVFRLAAQAVARQDSALGAFYRRLRARAGPEQAITATAYKIARIVYHMLKERQPYQPVEREVYERRQRERELKALHRKAAQLGFTLVEQPAQG